MSGLRRDWNEFWFHPTSAVPLGLFRMVFGALVFSYGLLLFPLRFLWFGSRGVLSVADADAYNTTPPSTYVLFGKSFGPIHWNVLSQSGSDHWLTLFFVVFLLAGLGLTLGFWTRTSSVIVYLCLLALHNRDAPIHNSGDTVMLVMSIYLILSPCRRGLLAGSSGADLPGNGRRPAAADRPMDAAPDAAPGRYHLPLRQSEQGDRPAVGGRHGRLLPDAPARVAPLSHAGPGYALGHQPRHLGDDLR